jgi:HEAT repeat protein
MVELLFWTFAILLLFIIVLNKEIINALQKRKRLVSESTKWSPVIQKKHAEKDIDGLIYIIEDDNVELRKAATEALGEIGNSQAIDTLSTALKDQNWKVRKSAAKALGNIGDLRALEPLIESLVDEKDDVRGEIASALGKIGNPRAVLPLIKTLEKEVKSRSISFVNVRDAAVEALGEIGDPRAIKPLISIFNPKDGDAEVALGDSEALVLISALKKIGEPVVDELIRILRGQGDVRFFDARIFAAKVLGEIGDADAIYPLIAVHKSMSTTDRFSNDMGIIGMKSYSAITQLHQTIEGALKKIDTPEAVVKYIEVLRDETEDFTFRNIAIYTLGKSGDVRAIEPLTKALDDSYHYIRMEAVQALGNINSPQANESLTKALKHDNKKVRNAAKKTLGTNRNKCTAVITETAAGYNIDYENGTILIGDLPIGARVVDPSWEWEFRAGDNYTGNGEVKPVSWVIVAKNHYGYMERHITLLSEELIGKHVFDNSTDRDHENSKYGYNHWGESGTANATRGLRPWLNSTDIHAGEGFYRAFSDNFKEAVLETTLPNKE